MRRLLTKNIIGIIGLTASVGIGALEFVSAWLDGPKSIRFIERPLATLAERFAGVFISTGWDRQVLAFALYLSAYFLLIAVFAVACWVRTSQSMQRSARLDTTLLVAQILISLMVNQQLLFVVAAELAFVLPRRVALAWLGATVLGFLAARLPYLLGLGDIRPILNRMGGFIYAGMELVWMAVAFGVGYVASTEKRSRIKLAGAHAELVATQQLLTDAIRASERVRIARDLHDAIGHHLTALNLHLDLALRQSGSQVVASLQTSRGLAQSLLAEVRVAVGVERKSQSINLRQALETLCAGIPLPRIALSFDDDVDIRTPILAHAIFCCVQEAISNAVRHSGARLMQIALSGNGDGLAIAISDDGKGMRKKTAGNGLQGIRERVEEMGGTLEIGSLPADGFSMHIRLPQSSA